VSAVYQDEYYNSKIDSDANKRKTKKIDDLFEELVILRHPGDYEIRWLVRDGTIGDIVVKRDKLGGTWPHADVRSSLHCLRLDIAKIHNNTLNVGWHGSCSVSWNIQPNGNVVLRYKTEQNHK
jgi:hypothetical protein